MPKIELSIHSCLMGSNTFPLFIRRHVIGYILVTFNQPIEISRKSICVIFKALRPPIKLRDVHLPEIGAVSCVRPQFKCFNNCQKTDPNNRDFMSGFRVCVLVRWYCTQLIKQVIAIHLPHRPKKRIVLGVVYQRRHHPREQSHAVTKRQALISHLKSLCFGSLQALLFIRLRELKPSNTKTGRYRGDGSHRLHPTSDISRVVAYPNTKAHEDGQERSGAECQRPNVRNAFEGSPFFHHRPTF